MAEPIMEFVDETQAYECLKEWQKRLFLDDWVIRLYLVEFGQLKTPDGDELYGRCLYTPELKTACVKISKKDADDSDVVLKYCAEKVLLHELLHCKFMLADNAPQNTEGTFFALVEHSIIEEMAKAFIMAKYGLPFEFFWNF